jgi:hypothetical protein
LDAQRLRRRQIVVVCLFFAVVVAVGMPLAKRLYDLRRPADPTGGGDSRLPAESILERPTAPPAVSHAYTGSAVCAECHAEIAEKYDRHPMGRSMAAVDDAAPIEDYALASFQPPGPRRYRVERAADGIRHHETLLDDQGETVYDQSVPIAYVLGSGQHGRSYLIERDGLLTQSPLGWYSQRQCWDLSPGYRPQSHARFERRVSDSCLYCHAGRVAYASETVIPANSKSSGGARVSSERYARPAFAEARIGCERCHGPGEAHVERQRRMRAEGRDDTIVNPARLDASRREAVCNQCHLQGLMTVTRYGRDFFDFRPGQHLDDALLVFVHGDRVDESRRTRPVSQVEQMRASRCFQESGGRMGCVSCHDPHEHRTGAKGAAHYQASCLKCHQDRGCSLPEAERVAAPAGNACVACHMPALDVQAVAHTSLIDHRILRNPKADRASVRGGTPTPDELVLFDNAADRLPRREVERATGIAMVEIATRTGQPIWAARAERLIVPAELADAPMQAVLDAIGDDVYALEALGSAYEQTERVAAALAAWRHALRFAPRSESLRLKIAMSLHDGQDWEAATEAFSQLIDVNPHVATYHGRYSHALGNLRRLEEAIAPARRALELDPTLTHIHEWLADLYLKLGREVDRERELAIFRRKQALFPELGKGLSLDSAGP